MNRGDLCQVINGVHLGFNWWGGVNTMVNISCGFLLKCLLLPGGADISLSTLLIWFSLK